MYIYVAQWDKLIVPVINIERSYAYLILQESLDSITG